MSSYLTSGWVGVLGLGGPVGLSGSGPCSHKGSIHRDPRGLPGASVTALETVGFILGPLASRLLARPLPGTCTLIHGTVNKVQRGKPDPVRQKAIASLDTNGSLWQNLPPACLLTGQRRAVSADASALVLC